MSDALAAKIRRDDVLAAIAAAVADDEEELGEITADEIRARQRANREDAVVRGRRGGRRTRST